MANQNWSIENIPLSMSTGVTDLSLTEALDAQKFMCFMGFT